MRDDDLEIRERTFKEIFGRREADEEQGVTREGGNSGQIG